MLRSEVRRRALRLLDEIVDAPVFFTVAEINDLINEACEVVGEEVRYIRRTGFLALRAGCMLYSTNAIDPYCLSPTRFWLMDYERALQYKTIAELSKAENRWMEHTAERPHHWFSVDHQTFGIYPRVTTSTEVLRVDFYAWPRPIPGDYSVIPFDDETCDVIIKYVVYAGLLKRWDIARASDVFAELAMEFQDSVYRKEARRFQYAANHRDSE